MTLLETTSTSITRLKLIYTIRVNKERQLRLETTSTSITRLKRDINANPPFWLIRPWNDKYLDYEIETVLKSLLVIFL